MITHSEFITPIQKVPKHPFSHLRACIGKPTARSHNKRRSSRDFGVVRDSFTRNTLSHAFSHAIVCQVVLSGGHPSLTFHALAWFKMKQCAFSKTVQTSSNMSYITPELTSTPRSFLSFGTTYLNFSDCPF